MPKCYVLNCLVKWCRSSHQLHIASTLYSLSDPELLFLCSTSPFAEGQDFIDNLRRYAFDEPKQQLLQILHISLILLLYNLSTMSS